MSDFKIKIEKDTYWKEIKWEDIGGIYCPECGTIMMINLVPIVFAYCPKCMKYFELMKKCKRCGTEYNANEIHFCSSFLY